AQEIVAMMGTDSAASGLERMLSGCDMSPRAKSQWGRGPTTGLKSQAQLRPERKAGTAQGRKTSAWTRPRPGKGRFSSSARTRPRENWKTAEATGHQPVLHSPVQE